MAQEEYALSASTASGVVQHDPSAGRLSGVRRIANDQGTHVVRSSCHGLLEPGSTDFTYDDRGQLTTITVDEDGAIVAALAGGVLVDTDDPRHRGLRIKQGAARGRMVLRLTGMPRTEASLAPARPARAGPNGQKPPPRSSAGPATCLKTSRYR